MTTIRKQVAGAFVLAAMFTAVVPVGAANADPGLDCVKKAVGDHVDRILNGGPTPMPCA